MTPQRKRLADAISRRDELAARIRAAQRAHDAVPFAFDELDAARERLDAARKGAAAREIDLAMGRTPATPTVTEAEAAVDEAQRSVDDASHRRAALAAEIDRLGKQFPLADSAVGDAIAALLRSDDGIAALLAQYRELQQSLATLQKVLQVVQLGLPHTWDDQRTYAPDAATVGAWVDALRKLRSDASAALPTDPQPPERKAA